MTLIILHYHLRPGGIRRVIELATPYLCRRFPKVNRIIVACGEANDPQWNQSFVAQLKPCAVEFFVQPALGYFAEQTPRTKAGLTETVRDLFNQLGADAGIVWAHNLGIGRNLPLTQALARACAARRIPLLSHHHDWWFENRWGRWREIQQAGFRSLDDVGRAIFPALPYVSHAAINCEDATILTAQLPNTSGWLPNLATPGKLPAPARGRAARAWLRLELGSAEAPVWILPCRLLRRKNVAEALLLTRWLRPGAWLVTTGGASSADERPYFDKLGDAARKHHWPLRLAILADRQAPAPSVPELMAASECVMLTSIQEGFGLPYLEAAAAKRPLIARSLPNISPDLARFGFEFPQYYKDIRIAPELFDWQREQARQRKRFQAWKLKLPAALRHQAKPPLVVTARSPRPVPFSQLTLDAQLEVLRHPPAESWKACAPLNPFLKTWQERAARGALQVSQWPRQAQRWLGGDAYARQVQKLIQASRRKIALANGAAVQKQFIRKKLATGGVHPLLWDSNV